MHEPSIRETRLRPQYADEYPGIIPGVWLPAAEIARKLVERNHARRRQQRYTRTFDPRHFEFRGAELPARAPASRTRATDAPR